ATSTRRTAKPDCANTCAIPLPIVPAPTTPTVFTTIELLSSSRPFDGEREAVAAAHAERGHTACEIAPFECIEQRRQNPAAARSDRVAQGARAAFYIPLGRLEAELLEHGDRLHRERLVELPEVDVLKLPAGLLQQAPHGLDGRHEHEFRRNSAGRLANDTGQRRDAESLRTGRGHHDEG